MRNVRLRLRAAIPFVAVIGASLAYAQDPSATGAQRVLPTHRYHFDERVDMILHQRFVYVETKAGLAAAAVTEALRAVEPGVLSALEVQPDGYLVELSGELVSAQAADGTLRGLLESPRVRFAGPVFHTDAGEGWAAVTEALLLRVHDGLRGQEAAILADLAPTWSIEPRGFEHLDGTYLLRSDAANGFDVLAAANRLLESGYFLFAEPDFKATGRAIGTPNDPLYPSQWGLQNIGQDFGTPGFDMDVDIAWDHFHIWNAPVLVIDDGVQSSHPDLVVSGGADFTGQGGGGDPVGMCDTHGTLVAGCIAARRNNNLGVAGIQRVGGVYSARPHIPTQSGPACTGSFTFNFSWVANALSWGFQQGVRISNNSNEYFQSSSTITNAYSSNPMTHFAAAGNSGSTVVSYPANLSSVNAVGALTRSGSLAGFSNRGPDLAFTAPGQSIWTTDRTGAAGSPGDYVLVSGTSFASPYAAAAASLYVSVTSDTFPPSVTNAMIASATDLGTPGFDTTFGHGLVNAGRLTLPLYVTAYGTGTPGCQGPAAHSGVFTAATGASQTFVCNGAPPNSVGLLYLSLTPNFPGTTLAGAIFHVGLGAGSGTSSIAVTSDASGFATHTVSIPNSPSLIGLTGYSQFLWQWTDTACSSAPLGLSSSNGITHTFQ